MKYRILLKTLQFLVYLKRIFWWSGAKILFILAKLFGPVWKLIGYVHYKVDYVLRKITAAAGINGQLLKRDNLQVIILLILFFLAIPQTKIFASKDLTSLPGQKTIAYGLTNLEEDYTLEEVVADNNYIPESASWRMGTLGNGQNLITNDIGWKAQDFGGVVAGGSALSKPIIFPGANLGSGVRDRVIVYTVQPGDSLSVIAAQFNISIATVLWENNLGLNSYIRPGDQLKILPVTGLSHTIKKGDLVTKIAKLYDAKTEEIVKFNKLKEDGSDLIVGERIIIPNGVKPQQRAVASVPKTYSSFTKVAVPASSKQSPSVLGFVWPTAARLITQYFSWHHSGLDVAGAPKGTAIYAAKAGVVTKSQCGWNSGYGCVVTIDHGGGVSTLYGHNSKLLVSVGERVVAGQTISLMGNTGNVRGITGIHLHFEIKINGVKLNPLGYVKLR